MHVCTHIYIYADRLGSAQGTNEKQLFICIYIYIDIVSAVESRLQAVGQHKATNGKAVSKNMLTKCRETTEASKREATLESCQARA